MRTMHWIYTVALLSLAGYGTAGPSLMSQLPTCAADCFRGSLAVSPCLLSDEECLCTDGSLQQMLVGCVDLSCRVEEVFATKNLSLATCRVLPRAATTNAYLALSNVFSGVIITLVAQRVAVRLFLKTGLGLDDVFLLLATCSWIPVMVMDNTRASANGLGRDMWTLTGEQIYRTLRDFFFSSVCYLVAAPLLKMSLLFCYLRVFPTRGMRRVVLGTMVFVALVGTAFIFAMVFQCYPASYFWTAWDEEHKGVCANTEAIGVASSVVNLVIDCWLLTMPVLKLGALNTSWRRRVEVAIMALVGTCSIVFSILRLLSLLRSANSTNPTWDYVRLRETAVAEVGTAIICVCLPSMRLLLSLAFPRVFPASQAASEPDGSAAEKFTRRALPRARKRMDHVFTEISLDGDDDERKTVWMDGETKDMISRLARL